MTVAAWEWWTLLGFVVLTVVVDGILVDRRPHRFTLKEAAVWVSVYVVCAAGFAVYVSVAHGGVWAGQFVAGYLTEYSLSIDNLFVFLVLMKSFAVPDHLRHRVLLVGIALALALRGVLIYLGSEALHRFAGTLFVFAAFLGWTAVGVWRSHEREPNPSGNGLVRLVERLLPTTREYHGARLTIRVDGKRYVTPMMLVVFAIGTTDLLFAIDSIPAVFGLTSEAFIVFSANAFALMGLRQLFFLLQGLMARLAYMARGLAVILAFIAVKLTLQGAHDALGADVFTFSTWESLAFIVVCLSVTVLVSMLRMRGASAAVDPHVEWGKALEDDSDDRP